MPDVSITPRRIAGGAHASFPGRRMPDLFLELRDESGGDEQTPAPPLEEEALDLLLRDAEFTASRLIPWGSNYSFAVALEAPLTVAISWRSTSLGRRGAALRLSRGHPLSP